MTNKLKELVAKLRKRKHELYLPNQHEYNGYATACGDIADELSALLAEQAPAGESSNVAKFGGKMSEFDKLLSDLANELVALDNGHGEGPNAEQILEVLNKKVLGLLEAGQAMRDCNYINLANSMKWDAAKQAAMEGR